MSRTELRATFRKPFAEQEAALRLRLGDLVPTQAWNDIKRDQHNRAFMVAGATKADLLADLALAVYRAIVDGTGYETFKRDFRAIVEKHGWHGWTGEGTEAGEKWRMRTIYRTNMRVSYAAGRHAQLVRGNYPIWVYRHGGSLEPRLHHLAWDGLALPREHPFWAMHYPPNGWGCSCEVYGARTRAGVRRVGGDPDKTLPEGWDRLDGKTGAPVGIDKGWDYAPGASVADDIKALNGKLPRLPAQIGARLFERNLVQNVGDLNAQFAEFVDEALTSYVQQRVIIIGALKQKWVDAAAKRGVRIESAEIAVTDKAVQHTFRGTPHVKVSSTRQRDRLAKVNPLDLDWYKALPGHLRDPRAVLLDPTQKEPVFLLIYDVPGSQAKLVVEVNTYLAKTKDVLNTVQSGRMIHQADILNDIRRGVVVIEGEV